MNVEFQGKLGGINHSTDNLNTAKGLKDTQRIASEAFGYTLDISGKDRDIAAFGKEELTSFEEIAERASLKNISLERNAMAVMSNSMSDEDFAKLQKEGFSVSSMNVEEAVTSLDKIKATLAESGVVIEGFTDTLSRSELEKITGNVARANEISEAFSAENVPLTKENISEVMKNLDTAKELSEPTDLEKQYMINNSLEPTVNNFYTAQFSSGKESAKTFRSYFLDASGYMGMRDKAADFEALKPQVEKIIEESGLDKSDDAMKAAEWLLSKDLPITGENIKLFEKINDITFPLTDENVIKASSAALSDGIEIKNADLTKTESFISMAHKVKEDTLRELNEIEKSIKSEAANNTLSKEEIKDLRVLEETRLRMTTEANLQLLRKGITIDTKNLEKLVDDLKEAEREFYAPLLMENGEKYDADTFTTEDKNDLTAKIDLYKSTEAVIRDLYKAPVEAVAKALNSENDFTLNSVSKESDVLKSQYEKANKSYETLMTVPRADLGDSIRKAFRNVDDILEELDLRVNEINEKAVRSLGYAGMEITEENIEAVSKANTAVENVISNMTPAKVLKMIRNSENPLDDNIYELAEKLSSDEEKDTQKYSEFLYKLDRKGQITDDEKSAFIGMFRLFRKIEKSDGKLVGNVLSSNDELTLNNLLKASRSNRAVGQDVKIDDSFGALQKLVTYGESITDQILKGFSTEKALEEAYIKEQVSNIREAMNVDENVMRAFEGEELLDIPEMTADNLLALDSLMNSRGTAFEKLMNRNEERFEKLREKAIKLQDNFTEEAAKDAYEEFVDAADESLKEDEEKCENYIDLKELGLLRKELSIASKLTRENSYEVPVEIDGEWTSINLKIITGGNEKGKVTATFENDTYGQVMAEFQVSNGRANALFVTKWNEDINALKSKEEDLKAALEKQGITLDNSYYTATKTININSVYAENNSEVSNGNVSTKTLYNVAKAFMEVITGGKNENKF